MSLEWISASLIALVLVLFFLHYILSRISISKNDILLVLHTEDGKTKHLTAIAILMDLKKKHKEFWQVRNLAGVSKRLERMEDEFLITSDERIISEIELKANSLPLREYRLAPKGDRAIRDLFHPLRNFKA